MGTLLLRLAAPLQSWGIESKFDIRQTEREPSKSGVIGLLASALGIRREDREALKKLSALSFGIRVEQEGQLLRDYHGAKGYDSRAKYLGNIPNPKRLYQTQRYYLADACFLAAVFSEDEALLDKLDQALRRPAFPLYLGRRSCPPTLPVTLGIRPLPLQEALQSESWQASMVFRNNWIRMHPGQKVQLRMVTDAREGEAGAVRRDVALSLDPSNRQYTFRAVRQSKATPPFDESLHDAMAEVEACT